MNTDAKHIRWPSIFLIVLTLAAIFASAIFGPVVLHRHVTKEVAKASAQATLQKYVESEDFAFFDEKPQKSILPLLPYESISFERTPCLGPCLVYVATFYRDGHATLFSDDIWQGTGKKYFTGKILAGQYVRLTQMVDLAKMASHKTDYLGQGVDGSSAIIRAKSKDQTWTVSDSGEHAPVEMWALEILLESFKDKTEWTPARGP